MESMTLTWWIWLIASLGLMLAELLLPTGFFVFFFGVGGVMTALLTALGLLSSFTSQGLAFLAISLACVVLLRKPLSAKFHLQNKPHTAIDSFVGQTVLALETIVPGATGRVEMYGSSWSAQNVGSVPIPADTRCTVTYAQGVVLHVTL